MDTHHLWYNHVGESTYWKFNRDRTELRIHTGRSRNGTLRPTGVLRIKRQRFTQNIVELHATLFHSGGIDDITRYVSRAVAGSMFAVNGYETGKLLTSPGLYTHQVQGVFIRDSRHVGYPVGSQQLDREPQFSFILHPELTTLMERFLEKWTFVK